MTSEKYSEFQAKKDSAQAVHGRLPSRECSEIYSYECVLQYKIAQFLGFWLVEEVLNSLDHYGRIREFISKAISRVYYQLIFIIINSTIIWQNTIYFMNHILDLDLCIEHFNFKSAVMEATVEFIMNVTDCLLC